MPPSSTATTIRSTRKGRTKTRNRYNNRYKENSRSRPGGKGKGRNLRKMEHTIQEKKYPDKRQHLDKLFEIAGHAPKSPQLNALLEIAGGRPNRQISQQASQPPAKKEFKLVSIK